MPYDVYQHDDSGRSDGYKVIIRSLALIFWGVMIFFQWQNAMEATRAGYRELSYERYGALLITVVLAVLSTYLLMAVVSWLKHIRPVGKQLRSGRHMKPKLTMTS